MCLKMYPYILYIPGQIEWFPVAKYLFSESEIKGIYSAQLLMAGNISFFLKFKSQTVPNFRLVSEALLTNSNQLSCISAYSLPLNELTSYRAYLGIDIRRIFANIDNNYLYHTVRIDANSNIISTTESEAFTYLIVPYMEGVYSNIGVKVSAPDPAKFLDGFLSYYRWLNMYSESEYMPGFSIVSYVNGRAHNSSFVGATSSFLYELLPPEVQEMISDLAYKEFKYVNKYLYQRTQSLHPPTESASWGEVVDEFHRRIEYESSVEHVLSVLPIPAKWKEPAELLTMSTGHGLEVFKYVLDNISDLSKVSLPKNVIISELAFQFKFQTILVLSLMVKAVAPFCISTSKQSGSILNYLLQRKDLVIDDFMTSTVINIDSTDILGLFLDNQRVDPDCLPVDIQRPGILLALCQCSTYDVSRNDYGIVRTVLETGRIDIVKAAFRNPFMDPSQNANEFLVDAVKAKNIPLINILLAHPRISLYLGNALIEMLNVYPDSALSILGRDKKLELLPELIANMESYTSFIHLLEIVPNLNISTLTPVLLGKLAIAPDTIDMLLKNDTFDPNMNTYSFVSLMAIYKQFTSLQKVVNDKRTTLSESNRRMMSKYPESKHILEQSGK